MHLKDDLLRALIDQELPGAQAQQVEEHLAQCADCQARRNAIAGRTQRVGTRLDTLTPGTHEQAGSPQAAYQRFTSDTKRFNPKKESIQTMFTRRPLWTALAIIAVLALVFTITPANAWASSLLGLFRVQKVQVITFDPAAAANARTQLESNQAAFEQVFKKDLKITHQGSVSKVASASEAAQKAGFTPRLPSTLTDVAVRPGMHAVFTIDQSKLQALLDASGVQASLPQSVNGKAITVDVQNAVVATTPGCQAAEKAGATEKQMPSNCTALVQLPSPVINTPDGLDVQQMGQAMFQLLGLSAADAQQLSQRIDWTSTLILPIPEGGKIQSQDVQVDGVTGTLLQETEQNSYSLIWVKDGVLYGLHGPGGAAEAQKLVASLH